MVAKVSRNKRAEAVLDALGRLHEDASTTAYREAAHAIVELRRKFEIAGTPDWTGRSAEYRELIERLYRQAEVPADSDANVQSKLRYHIGNVLREVAPPEELEVLGLAVQGPRGRMREARQEGHRRGRPPADVRRARVDNPLITSALALDCLRLLRVTDIDPEDRDAVERVVRQIIDEAVEFLSKSN